MSTDRSTDVEDQVDRAILDALHQRADPAAELEQDDEALISAVVAAHLDGVVQYRKRRNSMAWVAAAGLLAAAAAAVVWLPGSGDTGREATTVTQAETTAPTQAMWVLEQRGTPIEGIVVAPDRYVCAKRDQARACLTSGSRGSFDPDGNLELLDGAFEVGASGPIVLQLAEVRVQASTNAASFSATLRERMWSVSVESGTVTVTSPDGTSELLEAGESAGSPPPETASLDAAEQPVDAPEPSEPASEPSPSKPVPSADTLLELARTQRAARDFSAAARTYEQLVRSYPNSPKVRATLVSLAQLYQGPLDDPAKALRYFDRYLERGGPLAEEAHYGKIRALRSLGKTGAAQTEIDAFLQKYPNSAYADALK